MPYKEQGCNSWVMLPRSLEFPAGVYEHAETVMLGLHIHIASRFWGFFCFKNTREFFFASCFSKGKVNKYEDSL